MSKRGSGARRFGVALVGLATVVATFAAGHIAQADSGTWTDPSSDCGGCQLDITNVAVSNDASNVTYDITLASTLDSTKINRVAIQYDFNGDGAIDHCLDVVQSTYATSGMQGAITDRCAGGTVGSVSGPPAIPALPDATVGGLIGTATVTNPTANVLRVVVPVSTLQAAGAVGNAYSFRVGTTDTTSPSLFLEDDYAPDVPASGEVDFFTDQLSGVTTLPSLSINSVKKALSSGSSVLKFTVTLSAASATKTITVHYQTNNGSAVSPKDYAATNGTLTFLPGDLSHTISVTIHHGKKGVHTFTVSLSSATNAALAKSIGTGTIVDT
jgi:hypothetical protein